MDMPHLLIRWPPRFLRTSEAARFLGLSTRTLEEHRSLFIGSAFLVFGIGALCVLVCRLAIDALPAFAACTAGFWAYDTGAGPIGAIMVGLIAGASTLAAGRLVFDSTRSGAVRVIVALLFAAPAALAGYHVVLGL